jgi:drug/metabolite transporter (DMT)-like permease
LLALFAGATAIGFAPLFVRLSELGPSATGFHRLFLAMPVLWIWHGVDAARHGSPHSSHPSASSVPRGAWLGFVAAGLFFAGDLAFWHWSIRLTSVANATLLTNLAPVFVTLAAFALYGERFSPRFLAGMALALVGAAVLMGQSVTVSMSHLLGDGLGLVTAMFYGAYIVAVGRLRIRYDTATIMARSGLVTCVALLIVALASGESLIATSLAGWATLLALALFSHVGGQSLIAYALAHLPVAFSSVGLLLQAVVAAFLAWVLLGEALGPWQALGAAIVLAGIVLARQGSRQSAIQPPVPVPPSPGRPI